MKVNLLLDNPGDVRSGYLNIDPFAPAEGDQRVKGDVSDISWAVDDAEATEIVALDVIDFFPARDADRVLNNWLSKLARGGRLTVSAVDVREVARAFLAGTLHLDDVNDLLHGKQEQPWQCRRAAYTLDQLVEVLGNLGYKVLLKRVQNHRAVVTVERQ